MATAEPPLPNAFAGHPQPPTDPELAAALGDAQAVWDDLLTHLGSAYAPLTTEWKSYSQKAGWSLRVLRGKRTIVWVSPSTGAFLATFILGDKAMAAARAAALPARVSASLDAAPKYPEGSGVRLVLRNKAGLGAVKKLAAIKMESGK